VAEAVQGWLSLAGTEVTRSKGEEIFKKKSLFVEAESRYATSAMVI